MDEIQIEAIARHELHKNHKSSRPLSKDYELVGLRGEEVFAKTFGLQVDLTRKINGDNGIDNILCLNNKDYVVDIKCARKPYNLIVEQGKVDPQTIYILAKYYDEFDVAELLGWQAGILILQAPVKDFGYGIRNHYIKRDNLRSIDELTKRHTPKLQEI